MSGSVIKIVRISFWKMAYSFKVHLSSRRGKARVIYWWWIPDRLIMEPTFCMLFGLRLCVKNKVGKYRVFFRIFVDSIVCLTPSLLIPCVFRGLEVNLPCTIAVLFCFGWKKFRVFVMHFLSGMGLHATGPLTRQPLDSTGPWLNT